MKAPDRRAFIRTAGLSAVMATAALGAASAAPEADAELIGLCREFDDLERACNAIFDREDAMWAHLKGTPEAGSMKYVEAMGDKEREPLRERQNELIEEIMEHTPTTLAGVKALATTWRLWDGEVEKHGGEDGCINQRLAWGVLRALGEVAA